MLLNKNLLLYKFYAGGGKSSSETTSHKNPKFPEYQGGIDPRAKITLKSFYERSNESVLFGP